MASWNTSEAYDLSAYEALPQRKQTPNIKVVRSLRRKPSTMVTPRVVSSFIVVVTLFVLIVLNQVQLNEVSTQINILNAQLQELDSENVKMTSELESIISLPAIADYAKNELGMHKLDKYQSEYIYLHHEDKIELTEESPNASVGQQVQLSLTNVIHSIQEYIGAL